MKHRKLALACAALALCAPFALAQAAGTAKDDNRSGAAADAVKPMTGQGKAPQDRNTNKGAQEQPSGAQTGGMRTGIPEGAGKGGNDPAANKPSTKGADRGASPNNPRGAGDAGNTPSR